MAVFFACAAIDKALSRRPSSSVRKSTRYSRDRAHGFNIAAQPLAISVTERHCAPALLESGRSVMKKRRNRVNQNQPLEERLVGHAARLREEAKTLPPGAVRKAILKRAEQAETGANVSRWLRLPGSK